MQTFVKRFLLGTPFYILASISFLGATVSLKLQAIQSIYQFITTFILITSFVFVVELFSDKQNRDKLIFLTTWAFVLALRPLAGLASLYFVAIIITFSAILSKLIGKYNFVISSHFADAYTTFLLLPRSSEANIVVKLFIDYFGVIEGLILSKTLLVGGPAIYSAKYLEHESQAIFIKLVFLLGVSMAARNAMILFT